MRYVCSPHSTETRTESSAWRSFDTIRNLCRGKRPYGKWTVHKEKRAPQFEWFRKQNTTSEAFEYFSWRISKDFSVLTVVNKIFRRFYWSGICTPKFHIESDARSLKIKVFPIIPIFPLTRNDNTFFISPQQFVVRPSLCWERIFSFLFLSVI